MYTFLWNDKYNFIITFFLLNIYKFSFICIAKFHNCTSKLYGKQLIGSVKLRISS